MAWGPVVTEKEFSDVSAPSEATLNVAICEELASTTYSRLMLPPLLPSPHDEVRTEI